MNPVGPVGTGKMLASCNRVQNKFLGVKEAYHGTGKLHDTPCFTRYRL